MTELTQAIDHYHSLLSDEAAAESQSQLDEQQLRRGLNFGARKICTVLRPRFLTADQYRFLQDAIQSIMPAFDKAYRAALAEFLATFFIVYFSNMGVLALEASYKTCCDGGPGL